MSAPPRQRASPPLPAVLPPALRTCGSAVPGQGPRLRRGRAASASPRALYPDLPRVARAIKPEFIARDTAVTRPRWVMVAGPRVGLVWTVTSVFSESTSQFTALALNNLPPPPPLPPLLPPTLTPCLLHSSSLSPGRMPLLTNTKFLPPTLFPTNNLPLSLSFSLSLSLCISLSLSVSLSLSLSVCLSLSLCFKIFESMILFVFK